MKPPSCLLFDLDGTLIDSIPDLTTSLNILRSELDSPPLSLRETASMVGDGVTALVQRALGPALYSVERLSRFLAIYDEHLLDSTCCYPGIEDLLRAHPAEAMAVITNKPYRQTISILEGLSLRHHFRAVIGGDSLLRKKPDPLPVIKALEILGYPPARAVMIGDHHTDLNAGRQAGTLTCFCRYGFGHDDGITPDFNASEPTDLLQLFPG